MTLTGSFRKSAERSGQGPFISSNFDGNLRVCVIDFLEKSSTSEDWKCSKSYNPEGRVMGEFNNKEQAHFRKFLEGKSEFTSW